ncbi:RHS repeat-associated core domain-containing protein [Chryseobacterium camelliae]|uniref:RHS repeat-associated core domain-containing protein n=1 Tax=Chryseobacterium camelliae TaxID=1265445 RepID=A0ABY7QN60_9FLAO|nr:RHS repeat-associated core domain-containing protein [Chryseobacterium camelliae]WBV61114.1 RHS repeat-associated core domain-containing protein [Chryseobacterium camelliae]
MNASGEVKKYTVTTSWQNGATAETMSQDGTFAAGQLVKNSVTDEDGNTTSEFKNGKGQTLMVRKGNTETYYVYNKYDHLAFVIPPLASTAALDQTALNTLCYQYKYDSKSRQIAKKLPGKDWEYFVYDKMSRIVMSQDANMGASKQWLFTKYDQFGRVVYTGIYTGSQYYGNAGRETEQNTMNAVTVQTESRNAGGFNASGLTAYYTNTVYPTSFTKILSINYYDTYPTGSVARPSQVFGKNTIGDDLSQNINTKNLPTASYVKNIEDDSWTKNYIWYDEKARAIGTHSVNHLGGSTRTETELDFAGVVLQSKTYHKRLSSDTEKVITQNFEYDAQNRLKKQWHTVDGNLPELLAENSYNELSRLANKTVGNNLQSIDYTYNIRGALTKVNDPSATGKLFGYELKYYLPASTETGKRTGNIAEVLWKTASDQVLRKYAYQYDALNRMTSGTFTEPNASVPQNGFYNETATYDLGGNITALQRNGKNALNALALIDNLSYSYTGNRLNSVTDASADYNGYPDASGNTIAYDDNGNMKDHLDKWILQIDYNFLNLPDYVKFNQTYLVRDDWSGMEEFRNITTRYTYRSDGTKLNKIYTYGVGKSSAEAYRITEYLDGFQYQAEGSLLSAPALKFVPTSEGYYDFEKNKYIYSYTDHLGNVRLSYTKNGSGTEIIEENNYYPFGLKHQGYNQTLGNPSYQYEYSGKELQQETGWNDFGARMYMSDIGRWGVIDPLAETTTRVTPYNYALNNPVMFIDPDGRKAMYMGPEYELFGVENIGIINQLNQMIYNRFGSFTSFLGDGMPFNTGASSGGGGGSDIGTSATYDQAIAFLYFGNIDFSQFTEGDPPGNALSRFRDRTSNWVQDNIREPLSDWFDNNTRNIFALDAAGQARMDDFRAQSSKHMRDYVGGAIKSGAEYGIVGSGMGTGHVGAFSNKFSLENRIANFAKKKGIYSGQKGLHKDYKAIIEGFYQQMKAGKSIRPGAGFTTYDGRIVLTDGNHRMNAAIRYALETGDVKYIQMILKGIPKQPVDLRNYNIQMRNFPTK